MLNVVLTFVAVVGSCRRHLLAFGRQSSLPVVRWGSIAFIGCGAGRRCSRCAVHGLIMLPMFLPAGMTVN